MPAILATRFSAFATWLEDQCFSALCFKINFTALFDAFVAGQQDS